MNFGGVAKDLSYCNFAGSRLIVPQDGGSQKKVDRGRVFGKRYFLVICFIFDYSTNFKGVLTGLRRFYCVVSSFGRVMVSTIRVVG